MGLLELQREQNRGRLVDRRRAAGRRARFSACLLVFAPIKVDVELETASENIIIVIII